MNELVVLMGGQPIGVLVQDRRGDLSFTYDDAWRAKARSYPVSISMPLARTTHPDEKVRPFLEGLLPDNRQVLERWGRQFQVSPRNPFALLKHMGADCAGAVQFIAPGDVDAMLSASGTVDWLTEDEVEDLLRDVAERYGTGRLASDQGQFSLAGAQPKTALYHEDGRWGIPRGRIPTTHILKPPGQPDLEDFEINEHFCLNLASELDIAASRSRVRRFGDQPVIVVERYDRERTASGEISRLHQEDACQALGVPPWTKYENEGGPGAPAIAQLLFRESDDPGTDVGAFLDALVLNWAILGSDAHAKNYSLMLRPGSVRLAPLYDLLSVLPYAGTIPYRSVKLAMRIGREYSAWKVRRRHWEALAAQCELDAEPVIQRASELLTAIPPAARAAAIKLKEERLREEPIDQLERSLIDRSKDCLKALGS